MTGTAIVIGASIAGLLAARVLSEHFDNVLVLERDAPAHSPEMTRKGVPQGEHIHLLWSGGLDQLELFFPGISAELVICGSTVFDSSLDMRWHHFGVWKIRHRSGLPIISQSRPLLDRVICERVQSLPGVQLRYQHRLTGLRLDPDGGSIIGVEVETPDGPLAIDSALVVDASGRSAATLKCLATLGYRPPPEQSIGVDIGYATQVFRPPDHVGRDWQAMAVYARAPDTHRLGVIFPIEGKRWIVTLVGLHGSYLRTEDNSRFLDFAKGLDQPDLYHALEGAQALTPVTLFRYAAQLRRDFERMERLPAGLVPIGDAVCSLNPMYGQGLTVCALEARELEHALAHAGGSTLGPAFTSDYLKRIEPVVDSAWLLGSVNDFLYPGISGTPPRMSGLLGWYIARVLALSGSSPLVMQRFLEVIHFRKPVTALLAPGVLGRVLLTPARKATVH